MNKVEFINEFSRLTEARLINEEDIWEDLNSWKARKEHFVNDYKEAYNLSLDDDFFTVYAFGDEKLNILHYIVTFKNDVRTFNLSSNQLRDIVNGIVYSIDFNKMKSNLTNMYSKKMCFATVLLEENILGKEYIQELEMDEYFFKKYILEFSDLDLLLNEIKINIENVKENEFNNSLDFTTLSKLPVNFYYNEKKFDYYNLYEHKSDELKYKFDEKLCLKYKKCLIEVIRDLKIDIADDEFDNIEYIHDFETVILKGKSKLECMIIYNVISFILSNLDEECKSSCLVINEMLSAERIIILCAYLKFINKPLNLFGSSYSSNICMYIRYRLSYLKIKTR